MARRPHAGPNDGRTIFETGLDRSKPCYLDQTLNKSTYSKGRFHHTRAFQIPGLPVARPLTIYLPPGYDRGSKLYPVAYIFDGQNLFGDQGSFAGGWHLHDALDKRAVKGKVVPIVVGIHNGGTHRISELTPWPVSEGSPAQLEAFLDWVAGPLRRLVAEDLRVLDGPDNTLIGGSSLGGLAALYGYFRHNEVFGQALCMSPSLWLNEGAIFQYVARSRAAGAPRIYLDCGGREAKGIVIKHAEWMANLLARKGFKRNVHFMWRPDSRGAHNERNWRRRLPKALRYLYDVR